MEQKLNMIKQLIKLHNPSIVIINKLNLDVKDNISSEQFENFTLEVDNLNVTDQTSRTGVLIHKNLHYKRRRDLERPGLSTVWIQLRYPGRKPVFIQALYRQHQRLDREGSKAISSQQKRWGQILDIWEQVSKENVEIITMADFNLNGLSFEIPEDKKNRTR